MRFIEEIRSIVNDLELAHLPEDFKVYQQQCLADLRKLKEELENIVKDQVTKNKKIDV